MFGKPTGGRELKGRPMSVCHFVIHVLLQAPCVASEKELIIGCKFVASRVFSLIVFKAWSKLFKSLMYLFKSLSFPWGLARGSGASVNDSPESTKGRRRVDVWPTSVSREPMGAASRAWHHVARGAIKAGTRRSIVLCCGSKRTSRKSSKKSSRS